MPKLKVRSRVGDSCRNRLRPAPKTVQVIVEPMDTGRHTASTIRELGRRGLAHRGVGGDGGDRKHPALGIDQLEQGRFQEGERAARADVGRAAAGGRDTPRQHQQKCGAHELEDGV